MIFTDRFAAAKELAKKLQKYKHNKNAVILAIPRGGLQTDKFHPAKTAL